MTIDDQLSTALPFWDKLSNPQKKRLIEATSVVHYDKNATIRSANAECAGVLFIKEGSVRAYMLSEDGREITLYRMYTGDVCILSAACVLDSIAFEVSIDAVTPCTILKICPLAFSEIVRTNVYAEVFTYRLATERFSDIMFAMQQILFMSFDRRLATFLLDEAAHSSSSTIPMTHEQIAKLMGSAREVVTRMLKYFASEGYVALSRGKVTLLDPTGLKELL